MAKRTAIIDIGSNSVRMVIFERTSRFAFHIVHKATSRVRISENAYENNNNLQEKALERAYKALQEFTLIIKQYKANKTLCVATSALRDAPNRQPFINKIKKELALNIKVIAGEKESYLGGIAAANLLHLDSGLTIDIGGGSTELAFFENKKVIHAFSLNLGTVRLKELFFDKGNIQEAKTYIQNELSKLPSTLKHDAIVGIGGTLRSLSKMITQKEDLYFKKLHGFTYSTSKYQSYFNDILNADEKNLKRFGVKSERLDVIQPGLLILKLLIEHVQAKEIITSSVGVREGLYLSDLLRTQQDRFPSNYNPSVRSFLDRFDGNNTSALYSNAGKLFDLCAQALQLESKYKASFLTAIKLSQIGKMIDLYESHQHSYYMLLNGLNYGFSQEETILISTLVLFQNNKLPTQSHLNNYKAFLPAEEVTKALSFLMSLSHALYGDFENESKLSLQEKTLTIRTKYNYLLQESIKDLQKTALLNLKILD